MLREEGPMLPPLGPFQVVKAGFRWLRPEMRVCGSGRGGEKEEFAATWASRNLRVLFGIGLEQGIGGISLLFFQMHQESIGIACSSTTRII